jgi:hypothetical protein
MCFPTIYRGFLVSISGIHAPRIARGNKEYGAYFLVLSIVDIKEERSTLIRKEWRID